MRTFFTTLLALLLIVCGVIIFGMAGVRILQAGGFLRMDIDTNTAALRTDVLEAATPQPLLAGVESGSMALAGAGQGAAVALAAPADEPAATELPTLAPVLPTPDPCAPQVDGGFAADATVTAIGMVRLYSQPDLLATTLGEFSAGQSFLVTADTLGVTAVRRCELVWVRVRLTGGAMGWVLGSAIDIALPTVAPTVAPTASPAVLPPICPGGCATPTCTPCYNPCVQPCPDPCYSPCTQPCTLPCGVYSQ